MGVTPQRNSSAAAPERSIAKAACFPADAVVRTLSGPKAMRKLAIGDRVRASFSIYWPGPPFVPGYICSMVYTLDAAGAGGQPR